MTVEEIREGVRPAVISETIVDYPDPEKINKRHVGKDIQADNYARENNPSKGADNSEDTSASNVTTDGTQTELNELLIESIIGHRINRSKRHRYAIKGNWLCTVRWNKYIP